MKIHIKDKIPELVNDNNTNYYEYTAIVDKYIRTDSRELNFQNRAIIVLLERLLCNTDIEVVDTSTLFDRGKRNLKVLDVSQFSVPKVATPDILLTRNWNLDNTNNAVEYLAAIEIKSPVSSRGENIAGKKPEDYHRHIEDEIEAYLSANTMISKVILTDCYRWHFYEKRFAGNDFIDLVDSDKQWIHKMIKPDKYLIENLGFPKSEIQCEPDEWGELQKKILGFIGEC